MHHLFSPTEIADLLASWGYVGIFVCIFIGNVGIPVPEETVILAAGFLAGRDMLELKAVYLIAILSAVFGDCCGYLVGRTGGQRLLERLGAHFEFIRRRHEHLKRFFTDHGNKAVFMSRFIVGARFMSGPMAGACKMKFWRFLGFNLAGAVVWCSLMVTIGYLVGDQLARVIQLMHAAHVWVALLLVVLAVAIAIRWWLRRRTPAAELES